MNGYYSGRAKASPSKFSTTTLTAYNVKAYITIDMER